METLTQASFRLAQGIWRKRKWGMITLFLKNNNNHLMWKQKQYIFIAKI